MAGSNDLQLQLRDGTNTYTFDFDGRPEIEQEYQYNENPEPPELRQIVERWTFRKAMVVGADQATAWDNLQTFLGHVEDRTSSPLTHARLVRDPGGSPTVERTIGDTVGEGFRLESLVIGEAPVEELEASEFRTLFPIDLTLAVFRVFPDANGIVGWDQSIRNTYGPDGLHVQEMETSISVAEGAVTSALEQAQTYAVIDIDSLGNTYVWDTNSENGFDWEELDADTRSTPDKTPTKLRVISRVKQQGITVGTPSAGNGVGDVNYSVTTETGPNFTRTITEASATGPGALAWVKSKRPSGSVKEERLFEEQAKREANGRWVQEDTVSSVANRRSVSIRVTGGHQDFEYVPISGGFRPREAPGAFQPWRADVVVKVDYKGSRPSVSQMKFPPLLPDPWRLQHNLSREDAEPALASPGADSGQDSWTREAQLVYVAADNVEAVDFTFLLVDDGGGDVVSYFFDE